MRTLFKNVKQSLRYKPVSLALITIKHFSAKNDGKLLSAGFPDWQSSLWTPLLVGIGNLSYPNIIQKQYIVLYIVLDTLHK